MSFSHIFNISTAIFFCCNRYTTPLPMHTNLTILSKNPNNRLHSVQFIWYPLQIFWYEMIAKQHPDILQFEDIYVINYKFQNWINQKFTSLKTPWPLLILPPLLLFRFSIHMIPWLHHYLLPLLLFPREIIINITKNILQIFCFDDHIKAFRKFKNRAVTWNIPIN